MNSSLHKRQVTEARAQLLNGLNKHVKNCQSQPKNRASPDAYEEYVDEKTSIIQKFSNSPYDLHSEVLSDLSKEVEAEVFAEFQHEIDQLVLKLKSAETPNEDINLTLYYLETDLFSPWFRQKTYFCNDYFISLGGITVLLDFARSPDSDLQHSSLSTLWAFVVGERKSRQIVEHGALDVVIHLLRNPESSTSLVVMDSCGIMWGILEHEDLRNQCDSLGFVPVFVELVSYDDPEVLVIVLGCLQLLASSIARGNADNRDMIVEKIFGRLQSSASANFHPFLDMNPALMIFYLGFNCLARIILYEGNQLRRENALPLRESVLHTIDLWMDKTDPDEVRTEEKGSYLWSSVRCFTSLLFGSHPTVRRLGAYSLANLMQGRENRKVFVKEEGRAYAPIQCTAWCKERKVQAYAKRAMHHVYSDKLEPPSLTMICCFFVSDNFAVFGGKAVGSLPRVLQSMVVPFTHSNDA